MLYPLKFKPIAKTKIWGGESLRRLPRHWSESQRIGECWEISGLLGNESVVENGVLAGNTLNELLEVYMSDLVGDHVYGRYGDTFPLLLKLIDAADDLSVQVHPDDALAQKMGEPFGKTEIWYVLDAQKNAAVILGFKRAVTPEELYQRVHAGTLLEVLQRHLVQRGDVIMVPAGTVHAICKGCMLLELQQSSDTTYRLYDYDRLQSSGLKRPLHVNEALTAIDYEHWKHTVITPECCHNTLVNVADCKYFTMNQMILDKAHEYDLAPIDSFVLLSCVEGVVHCSAPEGVENIAAGETLLVPAAINSMILIPDGEAKLLEMFIR